MSILQLIQLTFDYHEAPLLKDISFSLDKGFLMHLKGANGAGKTTLLRLLAGLLKPTSGAIHYQGTPIIDQYTSYQENLCFIGHKAGISPFLTVKENCMFDLHSALQDDWEALAARFNLQRYLNTFCYNLSAGQRRQVALLKLWFTKASIWLLDEPFIALDHEAQSILIKKIQQHTEEGGLVVLTSHQDLPLHQVKFRDYYL